MKTHDLVCILIIAFTFFTAYHVFQHHMAPKVKPISVPVTYTQPDWAVIACDDFKKDRSRCGLVRIQHKE